MGRYSGRRVAEAVDPLCPSGDTFHACKVWKRINFILIVYCNISVLTDVHRQHKSLLRVFGTACQVPTSSRQELQFGAGTSVWRGQLVSPEQWYHFCHDPEVTWLYWEWFLKNFGHIQGSLSKTMSLLVINSPPICSVMLTGSRQLECEHGKRPPVPTRKLTI